MFKYALTIVILAAILFTSCSVNTADNQSTSKKEKRKNEVVLSEKLGADPLGFKSVYLEKSKKEIIRVLKEKSEWNYSSFKRIFNEKRNIVQLTKEYEIKPKYIIGISEEYDDSVRKHKITTVKLIFYNNELYTMEIKYEPVEKIFYKYSGSSDSLAKVKMKFEMDDARKRIKEWNKFALKQLVQKYGKSTSHRDEHMYVDYWHGAKYNIALVMTAYGSWITYESINLSNEIKLEKKRRAGTEL